MKENIGNRWRPKKLWTRVRLEAIYRIACMGKSYNLADAAALKRIVKAIETTAGDFSALERLCKFPKTRRRCYSLGGCTTRLASA